MGTPNSIYLGERLQLLLSSIIALKGLGKIVASRGRNDGTQRFSVTHSVHNVEIQKTLTQSAPRETLRKPCS